jgi:hypothetical protein
MGYLGPAWGCADSGEGGLVQGTYGYRIMYDETVRLRGWMCGVNLVMEQLRGCELCRCRYENIDGDWMVQKVSARPVETIFAVRHLGFRHTIEACRLLQKPTRGFDAYCDSESSSRDMANIIQTIWNMWTRRGLRIR